MATTKATEKTTAKGQAKPVETKATETKATEKPVEVKAEQLELDVAAESKKAVETAEKAVEKVTEKAAAAKKAVGAKKAAVKKEVAKKTTAAKKAVTAKKAEPVEKKTEKKEAVKATVHVQFGGKSITNDELVQIAKDVWKYDLKKKVGDFKTVDIYVKPEESMAYCVVNGEEQIKFSI